MTRARWATLLDRLRPFDDLHLLSALPDDALTWAEVERQVMMNLSLAYFCFFQSDPGHPDFLPFRSTVHTLQPNPDDTYLKAQIEGGSAYRIFGERGTARLLTFTLSRNVLGFTDERGEMLLEFDGDTITGPDGIIDLVLSCEPPATPHRSWLRMPLGTESILVRQRSYDWGREQDARLSVTRLDMVPPKPRMSAAEIEEGIQNMVAFAGRMTRHWLTYLQKLYATPPHQIEAANFAGGVQAQQYWQCHYALETDEVLVLETEIPEQVRYWNVQLNDMLWNTTEYIYRQSSLNGAQAVLDADGKFRAVIAPVDPGVPNWLDTGGHAKGTLVGRWYEANRNPTPSLTKIKIENVRRHLPAQTPSIAQSERLTQLELRARNGQLRRRW
jgi:hypothetical protein